jgi:hypothetical protein
MTCAEPDVSKFGVGMILFSTDAAGRNLVGDFNKDLQKGIYHHYIGASCGLMRKLDFQREDQPFLREAKIQKAGALGAEQLRELYSVNITLVGSNLYKNGNYIYVSPLLINSTKEQMTLLGLHGYYLVTSVSSEITENSFTTSIRALQEGIEFRNDGPTGNPRPPVEISPSEDQSKPLKQISNEFLVGLDDLGGLGIGINPVDILTDEQGRPQSIIAQVAEIAAAVDTTEERMAMEGGLGALFDDETGEVNTVWGAGAEAFMVAGKTTAAGANLLVGTLVDMRNSVEAKKAAHAIEGGKKQVREDISNVATYLVENPGKVTIAAAQIPGKVLTSAATAPYRFGLKLIDKMAGKNHDADGDNVPDDDDDYPQDASRH